MAEPHVITALVAKRAELSGEVEKLDDRRAALKTHISNIDAVLRLFRYNSDPAQIKSKRKRNWMFRRGELQRLVSDIERTASRPPQKDEIALEIMDIKGWAHDPELVETIADKVKDVRKRSTATG